jgi:hypothetical protein
MLYEKMGGDGTGGGSCIGNLLVNISTGEACDTFDMGFNCTVNVKSYSTSTKWILQT